MKNDSPFRDESAANTESVLEKLKRINEAQVEWETAIIPDLPHKERYFDGILRMFAYEDLPRLIAALELVESKAKQPVESGVHYGFGFVAGRIDFAREVLAVLNGGAK